MNIRAVIFDIYGTLLEVGPPPTDADARWQRLCHELPGAEPHLGRLDFAIACNKVIARHHEAARGLGILWPEVHWPSIVKEVLPALARLPSLPQEEWVFQQIQTGHTTRMNHEVVTTLQRLREQGLLLGVASNAQAYSVREFREALASKGVSMELFDSDLCFWSYEHGFSKPDPHVFQLLTTRLAGRGISPQEILMVGDRLDNDIEPARTFGWRTWQLGTSATSGWVSLQDWLVLPQSDGEDRGR